MSIRYEQRRKVNAANAAIRVQATVKVHAYPLLADALDEALEAGIRKLFKYVDGDGRVDEEYVLARLDTISHYLDSALCDVLDFGDD